MKIRILTFLLTLGVITFTSCDNDDDSSQIVTFEGTWNLKNISGGFAGIDDEYDSGIITWTFNNQNLMLNVINNSSQESIYSGYESGTYTYSITESNGSEYIVINTEVFGKLILLGNNLTLNQDETPSGSGADGFLLQFER
ncbi:hypothetical protein A9Q87_00995 [Flavobacteriales bacterium 34_180_T64]|nr:hypothetical protein A9Q87_00995 [Flavobacteriales bacterium 34_180_T64]